VFFAVSKAHVARRILKISKQLWRESPLRFGWKYGIMLANSHMVSGSPEHRLGGDEEEHDDFKELRDILESLTGVRGPNMANAGKEPPLPAGYEEVFGQMWRGELTDEQMAGLSALLWNYPSWQRAYADFTGDEFKKSEAKRRMDEERN
jgi:hypothetical protein